LARAAGGIREDPRHFDATCDFMLQLAAAEKAEVVAACAHLRKLK
jgi:hypothetical protein